MLVFFYKSRNDVTENSTDSNVSPDQLAELEPLSRSAPARLQELSGQCTPQRLPAGTTLLREGDTDNEMVYLLQAYAPGGGLQALPDDE